MWFPSLSFKNGICSTCFGAPPEGSGLYEDAIEFILGAEVVNAALDLGWGSIVWEFLKCLEVETDVVWILAGRNIKDLREEAAFRSRYIYG